MWNKLESLSISGRKDAACGFLRADFGLFVPTSINSPAVGYASQLSSLNMEA